jgi:hypothetical protein
MKDILFDETAGNFSRLERSNHMIALLCIIKKTREKKSTILYYIYFHVENFVSNFLYKSFS